MTTLRYWMSLCEAKVGYFYHMTSSRNLPGIQEQGLIPSTFDRANWGGAFAVNAEGKIFFADTPANAEYYGNILKHGMATGPASDEPSIYFAMLRVAAQKLPDIQRP